MITNEVGLVGEVVSEPSGGLSDLSDCSVPTLLGLSVKGIVAAEEEEEVVLTFEDGVDCSSSEASCDIVDCIPVR